MVRIDERIDRALLGLVESNEDVAVIVAMVETSDGWRFATTRWGSADAPGITSHPSMQPMLDEFARFRDAELQDFRCPLCGKSDE